MKDLKSNYPKFNPYSSKNEWEESYEDEDALSPTDAEDIIPDEVPRHDGPGGE